MAEEHRLPTTSAVVHGWGTLASGDNVDGWGRSGDQNQNVDGWGRSGDQDRPQEHENQYRAVWQGNMAVLDHNEATIEGASYTNSAAGSRSSSGIRCVQSSAGCRGSETCAVLVVLFGLLVLILTAHAWNNGDWTSCAVTCAAFVTGVVTSVISGYVGRYVAEHNRCSRIG